MSDLRDRLPAQSLMQRTLELHPAGFHTPSGEALSWYQGALGEIAVAGVLAGLSAEWTVLHSVPVGSGATDIDHVVIGPAGVFTLNTKSHPGQQVWIGGHGMLVSGRKTAYIGRAAAEAARAERLLSGACGLTVPVTPVVVLVNPGKRTIRAVPEGNVQVVADYELLHLLEGRAVFSREQTDRIVAAAVRPGTWHNGPHPVQDARATAIQFNAIIARALQGAGPAPVPQRLPAVGPAKLTPSRGTPQRPAGPFPKAVAGVVKVLASVGAIGVGLWVVTTVVPQLLQAAIGR